MEKWEYLSFRVPMDLKTIKIDKQKFTVSEYLNALGEQGWELVSSSPHPYGGFQLFFKKSKNR